MSDARASGLDVNIDELLEKVRKEKHQGKKLDLFEELLANTEIASLEPADPRRVKLKMHYQKAIMDYAKELQQLADHFASQLTDLENTSDKDVPPSHQSMITAYDNLANYLIQDILNKPTFEQQLLAYKRWIQVLKHSLEDCHDYHSASASINGLNSAAISKMKTLHKHLSDDEQQFIDKISHSFPVDQGWALMQARLDNQEPFTPNLGGIKKQSPKQTKQKKHMKWKQAFSARKLKKHPYKITRYRLSIS